MFNSLRLTVFAILLLTLNANATIIGTWNANSQPGGTNNFGGTLANTTTPPTGLTVSSSWARGSGVTQSGTGAASGWGGTNWTAANSSAAITAGQYVYFTITTNSSTSLSLSQIPKFNYRRSGSGAINADIYYSFDGSTWTTTGLSYSLSSSSSSGAAVTGLPGSLSSVSALQSIGASKTVYIAIVPYGASASTGSFYIFNVGGSTTAADFEIDGTTGTVSSSPSITSTLTASGTYGTAGFSYTITGSNTPTSYSTSTLPSGLTLSGAVISGTPTAAPGTYNVTISATNGSGTGSATLVITINAKALTVTTPAASNKVYDRTNAATITGNLSGIYSTDVVTLNGTGTFASINVATGIAVTSTSTLGGTNAANYALTQPTGLTANITAKALTISGAVANNKNYDGTTAATISGSLSGIISPDVVTLNGTGTFASSAVGNNIPVTSTSTLGGANAGNYSLTQPTGLTANIVAAPAITSSLTASGTYGTVFTTYTITATNSPTSYGATGLPTGLSINTSTGDITGTPTQTGTISVTITATNGNGTDTKTLVITIAQKTLTVSAITVNSKTYTGTNPATYTGTLNGIYNTDVVTLNGTGTFATVNVANGISVTSTATLGGTDAANYTLTQPTGLTGNITKANQTITFAALPSKTTVDADFSPGATSPTSGVNAITYTSSNTSVATIVSGNIHIVGVGTTNITASEAGSANYNAAADVIQPLTVTTPPYVSFDNFNRTASNTVGIPSSGGSTSWAETETTGSGGATAEISSNELFLTNTNSTGGAVGNGLEQIAFDMSSKYSTTFSQAPNAYTWVFNFRPTRSSPSGFSTTNTYGTATVLGCTQSSFTASTANGYAVIVGNAGSPDPVKFVSFTGGLTSNANVTDIATSSVTTENDYYSVKITYTPCTGQWALQVRDDGTSGFADPTTITSTTTTVTATDQTYTSSNLKYFGCLFQHGSSNGESVAWDNIYIPTTITASNTYTWNGGTGDYQVATNWTPNRTCPQPNDVLLFTQTTNVTTNVPTQTIGRLVVSTGASLTMRAQTSGTRTLSIQGGTGTDLDIPATSSFNIDCDDPLIISILTGATANIAGNFTFNNTIGSAGRDHRLIAADAGSITFTSGAVCTAQKLSGNPFDNTGTANVVVFQSGSSYVSRDGANPFGLTEPASRVTFNTGSLYSHEQSGAPSFPSRIYADFQFNYNGANTIAIGGSTSCTVDNFSILQGNVSFPLATNNLPQSITINGNFSVSSGASFSYAPTSNAAISTLSFAGSAAQTITNNGTLTLGANSILEIKNANNVTLNTSVTTSGALTLTTGQLITGSNTATIATGGTVSRTSGWVNGNLQKAIAASTATKAFEIGDATYYAPVTLSFTGTTNGTGSVTAYTTSGIASQTQISASGLNIAKAANRIWTVTNSGVASFTNADATLQYNTAEILGGGNVNNFYIRRYNGTSWTPNPDNTLATNTVNSPLTGQNTSKTTTTIPLATFASGSTLNFVTGEKNTLTITCPSDITANNDANLCSASEAFVATISSTPTPTLSYSYGGTITSPYTFAVGGPYAVTATANNINGSATCSFNVTVNDNQVPVITTCAGNQTLNLGGNCQASLPDYRGLVSASDNCTASASLIKTQTPAPGTSVSGTGNISVSITATDATGNVSLPCNFTVVKTNALAVIGSTLNNPTTCSGSNGSIVLSGSLSANTTYSVTYNKNGSGVSSQNFTSDASGNLTITGLTAGAYNNFVIGVLSCSSTAYPASGNLTLNDPAGITAGASNGGPYFEAQTIALSATPAGAATYQWSGPGGFTASGSSASRSNALVSMSGNYTVTVTAANNCSSIASTNVVVNTVGAYTWTGAISTDWATPGNWSPTALTGGPNSACAVDVIIPSVTNNPVISSTVSIGKMQISANAQLTLNADINVCKDWVGGSGASAIIAGTGKINLTGSSLQQISGKTDVQELLVNNTAGVSMQSAAAVNVYKALDLQNGNYDAANGNLTFKSTSVNSVGIINNFSSGYQGTLSGSINAERYYDASNTYNQHYMGSPVNAPSLSQFGASGTPGFVTPTANCDETKLSQHSAYGTVFSLDESNGSSCVLAQWKVETSGNAQNAKGYSVMKTGTGTITLSGNANLNSSYTVSNLANHGWTNSTYQARNYRAGWQLISNPYLATLNITTTNSGFDNQVMVWNANGPFAGSYQLSNVIAPFQAFMVHKTNTGTGGTYTINASDRVTTAHTFYALNANQLNIVAENTTTGLMDQTTIGFDAAATDSFDAQLDADKMPGALNRHTIYSVNNGTWLSKNILNAISTTATVPVGFEPGASGSYVLTFNGINTFDATSYITLEDTKLNTFTDVRNGQYAFTADSADSWNRFVLHFTPAAVINTTTATCASTGVIEIKQPGTANWVYVLTDSNNAIITSGVLNQDAPVTVGVTGGTYTLTLVDGNNYTTTKVISVAGSEPITAAFNTSATTIEQNAALTLTSTTANATTYAWDFGNHTTGSGQTASVTYQTPGVYNVELTVTNASGCSSTTSRSINVTANSATGINNITENNGLAVYSNLNKVYVDFTNVPNVDATVIIYNVLGQQLSNEHYTSSNIYQKEIDNIDGAYLLVSVKQSTGITTKKVFISGSK